MPINQNAELRTLDPVLTTLAQGYSNANYVGQYLFPIVELNKSKGRIPLFGKNAFMERKVGRAAGANSNRIPLTDFELLEFECTEKDIEMAIDYLEEENTNDFYKFEQRTVRELSDVLQLGHELEAARIATEPDNFADDCKIILDETNAFNSQAVDPMAVLLESIAKLRANIGVMPNTMIISITTFNCLIKNLFLIDRIKYSTDIIVSINNLSKLLNIENVKIGLSVYSKDGISFEDVWGNNVVIAYIDPSEKSSRSELNPSYGYTFRRKGMPETDVYYEAGGKVKVIRNTDNYCIKTTAPNAAYLISNTIIEPSSGE